MSESLLGPRQLHEYLNQRILPLLIAHPDSDPYDFYVISQPGAPNAAVRHMLAKILGPERTIDIARSDLITNHPSFLSLQRAGDRVADQLRTDIEQAERHVLRILTAPAEKPNGQRVSRPHLVTDMASEDALARSRDSGRLVFVFFIAYHRSWSVLNLLNDHLRDRRIPVDIAAHNTMYSQAMPNLARRIDERQLADHVLIVTGPKLEFEFARGSQSQSSNGNPFVRRKVSDAPTENTLRRARIAQGRRSLGQQRHFASTVRRLAAKLPSELRPILAIAVRYAAEVYDHTEATQLRDLASELTVGRIPVSVNSKRPTLGTSAVYYNNGTADPRSHRHLRYL